MPKETSEKDYAHLGKALAYVLRRDYLQIADNWKRFIFISFVRGIFVGVGSVIGATVVVGILLWALSLFDRVPLVGELVDNIQQTVRNRSID